MSGGIYGPALLSPKEVHMKTLFISFFLLFFAAAANTKIVFYSKRDGNAEIYTMNDDGSHLRRITNNPNSDYVPIWAPDGKTIAFGHLSMENRQQLSYIIIMDANGSNKQILTTDDEARSIPTPNFFTRDGQELAIMKWDFDKRT